MTQQPSLLDMNVLAACKLCPRRCDVDRTADARGVCGEPSRVRLARAALHYWEEPPISGQAGSGTVFFSGCTLRCVYCQNREISTGEVGREVSVERLAQIFLEQQARGANNINLVTPTQFAPHIIRAIDLARAGEVTRRPEVLEHIASHAAEYPFARLDAADCLEIPIVCNTGGYEDADVVCQLEGYVDVFLTDFKYASPQLAQRYSKAADYPQVASRALDAMYSIAGPAQFAPSPSDGEDIMTRGIIVRHLMLPGCLEDSKAVVDLLAGKPYAQDMWVSLMNQYTPLPFVKSAYPELDCTVTVAEYDELIDYALDAGLENSFMQEGGTAEESFIPAFDYEGV